MVTKKTTRTSKRKYSNRNTDLTEKDILNLPLLPIRNTVLLPNLVTPLIVEQEQSLKAIEEAMKKDRILFVVAQLNEDLEDPGQDDVYTVGVEGMVDRILKMPELHFVQVEHMDDVIAVALRAPTLSKDEQEVIPAPMKTVKTRKVITPKAITSQIGVHH